MDGTNQFLENEYLPAHNRRFARQLNKVGKLPKGKSFAHDVQVKLMPDEHLKSIRLVVFAQEPGPGKLLGCLEAKILNPTRTCVRPEFFAAPESGLFQHCS